MLDRLNSATEVRDMDAPGYDFHPLKGDLADFYSIHVNGNWTIIFQFEKDYDHPNYDVINDNYEDIDQLNGNYTGFVFQVLNTQDVQREYDRV